MFTFSGDDSVQFRAYLTLHESLKTPEDRTQAVGDVVKCLGEEIIPGTRNEVLFVIPIQINDFNNFQYVLYIKR